jgi:hypothetical protein
MALADTGKAIGAVSDLLQSYLLSRLMGIVPNTHIGRPEAVGTEITNPRLNLFLYEVQFEPSLRNQSLDEGQPAPLWLVLKYVLSAFDLHGESDSIEAHKILGEGIRALQEMSFLKLRSTLGSDILNPLKDNPEELIITFDQTSADLISKLMQGPDEKYRCSVSFEVRPVMIATSEPSSYALLVGINYLTNTVIGEAGIQIPVLPSMGPVITRALPEKVEPGATLTIEGTGLEGATLTVRLGSATLPISARSPNALQCQVNGAIADGNSLSAGSHPLAVVQPLPSGRMRSSNLLLVDLLPVLTTVTSVAPSASEAAEGIVLKLDLAGQLLGRDEDDVFVALYRDGQTIRLSDEVITLSTPAPPPFQAHRQARFRASQPIPPGSYRAILRVNGQQARRSPEVTL